MTEKAASPVLCASCGGDGWAMCSDPGCTEWRCIPCPVCSAPSGCETCHGTGKAHEWVDIDDDEYYKATIRCPDCSTPVNTDSSGTP